MGYSINLLTLLALVLAIGLVVDDAIVVVENIHRHIEEGMTPYDAAIKGAHEIALPVVAMTITLAAVYAPIGFVSGVTGVLFREFAFTLAARSSSRLHRADAVADDVLATPDRRRRKAVRPPDGPRVREAGKAYQRRLHASLEFSRLTLLMLAGVLALTGIIYASTPARTRAGGGPGLPARR